MITQTDIAQDLSLGLFDEALSRPRFDQTNCGGPLRACQSEPASEEG